MGNGSWITVRVRALGDPPRPPSPSTGVWRPRAAFVAEVPFGSHCHPRSKASLPTRPFVWYERAVTRAPVTDQASQHRSCQSRRAERRSQGGRAKPLVHIAVGPEVTAPIAHLARRTSVICYPGRNEPSTTIGVIDCATVDSVGFTDWKQWGNTWPASLSERTRQGCRVLEGRRIGALLRAGRCRAA
jgi:hypothetical protein